MTASIDVKTRELLSRLLSGFKVVDSIPSPLGKFTKVDLPVASGAEYFFTLWFYADGEREIGATLTGQQSDDAYLWGRPFELAEFRRSKADLVDKFCEELEVLLTHETRIIQRKGWLFLHSGCEYRTGELWTRVYSHATLRIAQWKKPRMDGRIRVYKAGAIAGTPGSALRSSE